MIADEPQLTKMFERIPGLRAASPRRLAACSLPVLGVLALTAFLLWPQGAASAQTPETPTTEQECSAGTAVPNPKRNSGLVADCVILLDARDTLAGSATLDWSANAAVKQWQGITVSGKRPRVKGINLARKRGDGIQKVNGTVPAELGNLKRLERLYLTNNELTGSIPKELGKLENLTDLGLGQNRLTGPIPKELGKLSDLEYLVLHDNRLTGSIPKKLGRLSRLDRLDFYSNRLTGRIPKELGRLEKLTDLDLSQNWLTGPIPKELGKLSELKYLSLHNNLLTGRIPRELGNLSNLNELHLHYNKLTGPIPKELGKLSKLYYLTLYLNRLSGSVPAELGNPAGLSFLNIRNNDLEGCLPTTLRDMNEHDITTDLPWCDDPDPPAPADPKAECEAEGTIPEPARNRGLMADCVALLTSRDTLLGWYPSFSLNWKGGVAMSSWKGVTLSGKPARVTQLDLPGKGEPGALDGRIPGELGDLSKLTRLDLSGHYLRGFIPPRLGRLSNLTHLNLSNSNLYGDIPPELSRLTKLTVLDLRSNSGLKGCMPKSLRNLPSLGQPAIDALPTNVGLKWCG